MSDYIIHNIDLVVSPRFDFNGMLEDDKPVAKYPNYYLGKVIGNKGNELNMFRPRRGEAEEHVPNRVLRNENGIALIRVHNKENLTMYNLPDSKENEQIDCVGVPAHNYPFGYVVVDYRDGKCQVAIEKTSAWDSKTVTVRNSLEAFFNFKLTEPLGIKIALVEKKESTQYERFIDDRTNTHGDVIESFTVQYVNLKRKPTTRVPEELTEQMEMHSKILEMYDAISGTTTMQMGDNTVDKDKLKQLSRMVAYSSDNAFDLITHFRDFGDYTCNESIVAKYPMNDIVISNYKDKATPEQKTSDFDMESWLDKVFCNVKGEENGEENTSESE